jgi:hypothetical protein
VRERRLLVDLDERGEVVAWSATGYDTLGIVTWCHVCPVAPPEDSDLLETVANLAGMEPDVQLSIPLSWERWQGDKLAPEGETPIPARSEHRGY